MWLNVVVGCAIALHRRWMGALSTATMPAAPRRKKAAHCLKITGVSARYWFCAQFFYQGRRPNLNSFARVDQCRANAQPSPLRKIAELWESIARSYQLLINHEGAQIERSALGS